MLYDEICLALKCTVIKSKYVESTSVEFLEELEDYGIDKIVTLLNHIYDTGQIPGDMPKSIFIAVPKKPGATERELHRMSRRTARSHII